MIKKKRTKASIQKSHPLETKLPKTVSSLKNRNLSPETKRAIKLQSAAVRKAIRPFKELLSEFKFARTGWDGTTVIFAHEENPDEEVRVSLDQDWNIGWSFHSSKSQNFGSDLDSLLRMLLFSHQRRVIQLGPVAPDKQ